MNLYERYIFPHVLEWAMSRPEIAAQRPSVLAEAEGRVLEIGFGTGRNLPFYPPRVKQLWTLEPNEGMSRLARRRIDASDVQVEQVRLAPGPGNRIEADDASFDTIVSTWTLCTIAEVNAALAEMHRVLRPGGRFLFIEHGLSPDPDVAKWQHRLNPINRVIGAGCNLDRPIRGLIAAQPWRIEQCDEFYLEHTPRIGGYMYRGTARREK